MASCLTRAFLILCMIFPAAFSYAQSPKFGKAYNSKTGKKDMCIRMRSEDGATVDSKRCKELRITDGYFTEETDWFLINSGSAVSGSVSMASNDTAVSTSHAHVFKAIDSDPAFSSGSLANGISGQTLTLEITEIESDGTWTLTPTTSTGFTSLLFEDVGDLATLSHIDDTTGWIRFNIDSVQSVE